MKGASHLLAVEMPVFSCLQLPYIYALCTNNNKAENIIFYDSIMIFIGEHIPPLHLLSDTLQAATPRRTSISALKTTLSPGFERGDSTAILPSAFIFLKCTCTSLKKALIVRRGC